MANTYKILKVWEINPGSIILLLDAKTPGGSLLKGTVTRIGCKSSPEEELEELTGISRPEEWSFGPVKELKNGKTPCWRVDARPPRSLRAAYIAKMDAEKKREEEAAVKAAANKDAEPEV